MHTDIDARTVTLTADTVTDALRRVPYPGLTRDLVSFGMVEHVDVHDGAVTIRLGVHTRDTDALAMLRRSVETEVLALGATGVAVEIVPPRPKVSKAVKQFARGVAWPELDVLVVDLPPGTGDIPVSLAQAVVLSGAIVVTQPPRVAAAEARKAAELFRTLEVPVLGIVETMSGAFGRGAGRTVAGDLAVPFLGEVPFDHGIVSDGDAGVPTVVARPHGASATAFRAIAHEVAASLGWARTDTARSGA